MSKQIGLIKVKGNLDGVSFYQSQGENFVRMAKGPSKQRILTDPAFQRTRENNREFGGSAQAAKAFRGALAPALFLADKQLVSRTFKVFKAINSRSMGIRGQRPIEISSQRALLENIELNQTQPLGGIFYAPFSVTHTRQSLGYFTGSGIQSARRCICCTRSNALPTDPNHWGSI